MLAQILQELQKKQVKLVAVSKKKPVEQIQKFYNQGHKIFGENYIQELKAKQEQLPNDIEWHFIGHLQSNKVKDIAAFIRLIHTVDSLKLLTEINKRAKQNERIIDCLLQFHIAQESSKFGLQWQDAQEILTSDKFNQLHNVNIVGVMGMASFTEDQNQVREEFRILKSIFDRLKSEFFNQKDDFYHISMGMSGDYPLAIEEGSTMVRIGSLLFGKRD